MQRIAGNPDYDATKKANHVMVTDATCHDLPKWWPTNLPANAPLVARLCNLPIKILCLISVGNSSPEGLWELTTPGRDADWTQFREGLIHRTSNMNIVVCATASTERVPIDTSAVQASLVLTTSATFLSSQSPVPVLLHYTSTGPYILIMAAAGMAGVAVGSGAYLLFFAVGIQPIHIRVRAAHQEPSTFNSPTCRLSPERVGGFGLHCICLPPPRCGLVCQEAAGLWVMIQHLHVHLSEPLTLYLALCWSAWAATHPVAKSGIISVGMLYTLQCALFATLIL